MGPQAGEVAVAVSADSAEGDPTAGSGVKEKDAYRLQG